VRIQRSIVAKLIVRWRGSYRQWVHDKLKGHDVVAVRKVCIYPEVKRLAPRVKVRVRARIGNSIGVLLRIKGGLMHRYRYIGKGVFYRCNGSGHIKYGMA